MGNATSEAREDASSFLVRTGLLSREELEPLYRAAAERGTTVMEEAVLGAGVDEEALAEALVRAFHLRRVPPEELARIPGAIIEAVPGELCVEHRLVPVARENARLEVAIGDPCDSGALDELAFFTETEIVPAVATQRQIAWCLARYYGAVTPLGETLLERREPARERPGEPPARAEDEVPAGPSEEELRPRAGEISAGATDSIPDGTSQGLPPVVVDDSLATSGAVAAGERREQSGEVIQLTPAQRRRSRTETAVGVPPPSSSGEARLADQRAALEDEISTEPGRFPSAPGVADADAPDADAFDADAPNADAPGADDPFGDPEIYPYGAASPAEEPEAEIPATVDAGQEPTAPTGASPEGGVSGTAGARGPDARGQDKTEAVRSDGQAEEKERDEEKTDPGPRPLELEVPAAPDSRPAIAEEEEGFGPPGTTIPPPFLGAAPQSYEDLESGAIPVPLADEGADSGAAVAPPESPEPAEPPTDTTAALERASAELLGAIRALEASAARDDVIEALIGYVGRRYERAGFFVVKARELMLWSARGTRRAPAERTYLADVPLFADVAERLAPYRGPAPDDATAAFFERWVGARPGELFILPVAVRGRAVGIVCGDTRAEPIYDAHAPVLALAAGDALERALRARKRT